MKVLSIILCSLLLAHAAFAEIRECRQPNGDSLYTDQPCPKGSTVHEMPFYNTPDKWARIPSPPLDTSAQPVQSRTAAPITHETDAQTLPQPVQLRYSDRIEIRNLRVSAPKDEEYATLQGVFYQAEIDRVSQGLLQKLTESERVQRRNFLRVIHRQNESQQAIQSIESLYRRYDPGLVSSEQSLAERRAIEGYYPARPLYYDPYTLYQQPTRHIVVR